MPKIPPGSPTKKSERIAERIRQNAQSSPKKAGPVHVQTPKKESPAKDSKQKTAADTKKAEPVRSYDFRSSTKDIRAGSETAANQRAEQRAENPKKSFGAQGRAVKHDPKHPTADINQAKIDQLKSDKDYKKDTFRVHYKGERDSKGNTSGTRLVGQSLHHRSKWDGNQEIVRDQLGERLKAKGGHTELKSRYKDIYAENAHVRRHAAGGLMDPLGGQPASAHFNTEDLAREDAEKELHKKHNKQGDNVRMKSTTYIHASGEEMGTIKARRHKIYFKDAKGVWNKKFDFLQDGHRRDIDKKEAEDLSNRVKGLNHKTPDDTLHPDPNKPPKGIPSHTDVSKQKDYRPTKKSKTVDSPYFTDLTFVKRNGYKTHKTRHKGYMAAKKMDDSLAAAVSRFARFGKIKG